MINELKFKDEDDIYLSIGSYRYTAGFLINMINSDKEELSDVLIDKKKTLSKSSNHVSDVIVDGDKDILITLAKCCNPVKGDEIVGYVTKTQGVKIHKKNCSSIPKNSKRFVPVEWDYTSNNRFNSNLYIYTNCKDELLSKIIEVATKKDVKIQSFNTRYHNDITIYQVVVMVRNTSELDKIINEFAKISHVSKVSKELI